MTPPDLSGWTALRLPFGRQLDNAAVRTGILLSVALVLIARALADMSDGYAALRERAFDSLLRLAPQDRAADQIAIVDIDRRSLDKLGHWPWSRDQIGALVEATAAAKPKVIAIDILIAGPDERSPAALARRLSVLTQNGEVRRLAGELADGDARLAAAVARVPTAMGLGLDPDAAGEARTPAQVLVNGELDAGAYWTAAGAVGPDPPITQAAAGFGALLLPGDADGNVRRVPLLTLAGGAFVPGLAVEAVRLSEQATALMVVGDGTRLRIGGYARPLPPDGMLRLLPAGSRWSQHTLSAAALLQGESGADRLGGRFVLIGSSAPELGGLRSTAAGLTPSVHLQADALRQLLAGELPVRPIAVTALEYLAGALLAAGAVVAGMTLGPVAGGALVLVACAAWLAFAAASAAMGLVMVDPLFVPAAALTAFGAASLANTASTLRREALIRRRFEQHLAPEVVSRIVARPDLLKLEGEVREVTAMFTDIEGFTAMTERCDPKLLVAALDRYFEGVTQLVVEHGGMIDKIVGDGVHVLFNAPLDLENHPARAVACARAVSAFSENFRGAAEFAALGFGRTRIGIETGEAVIGDVGGGRKLDYTAHGNAVNAAARLEAANKELGSVICIGPAAASRVDPDELRPLGSVVLRGRSAEVEVFDLWPDAYTAGDRAAFREALALAAHAPAQALPILRSLSAVAPSDAVLALVTERCTADAARARAG